MRWKECLAPGCTQKGTTQMPGRPEGDGFCDRHALQYINCWQAAAITAEEAAQKRADDLKSGDHRNKDDHGERLRCTFDGCWQRTLQPYTDGWAGLSDWAPGIKDGWYCKPHADALEALYESGELEYIQRGAR
jgi:hypothetical protein